MLSKIQNEYYISTKKPFEPIGNFIESHIDKVFDFSYDMTFGRDGQHRDHRSGGNYIRDNIELFINTLQGKLAEFGIYDYFTNEGLTLEEPDLSKWELGKWDTVDLIINNKQLNIKSTKYFGNLLLFETKDWNEDGLYIPNIESNSCHYDYFTLIRIHPNTDDLYSTIEAQLTEPNFREELQKYIKNTKWKFDIPGYMTHVTMKWIIENERILPQNSLLNGKIRMDAENYYIETGDLKDINMLIEELKSS